jgi:hypothetical protein
MTGKQITAESKAGIDEGSYDAVGNDLHNTWSLSHRYLSIGSQPSHHHGDVFRRTLRSHRLSCEPL